MRFGCAVPASSARAAKAAGFDFVELRVSELDPLGPDLKFLETARAIERAGIPAETFAFLLPKELKVVGPSVDADLLRRWVAATAERASRLGGRLIVVGSGEARRVPGGFPPAQAMAQLTSFLAAAADEASIHDIALALEPLNQTETNLLHSLSEAVAMVESIAQTGLGVVADVYHMRMEEEPVSHLLRAGDHLLHVQLADSGRLPPGQGNFDFRTVFTFLNAMGYDATVALECSFVRFGDEARPSLEFVRRTSEFTGSLVFRE